MFPNGIKMEVGLTNRDLKLLFDKYAKNLCLYAMNYLPTKADAEDIVQDIFMHFWEKDTNRFADEKAAKVYLFNSVRNACIDKLEKKGIKQCYLDQLKADIAEEESLRFDENILHQIQKEIEQMPEQTQRIIKCIFNRGMKYQETADELGISINTVKTLLRNGIKHLRNRFSNQTDILFLYFKIIKR